MVGGGLQHFSVSPKPLDFGFGTKGFGAKGLGTGLDNFSKNQQKMGMEGDHISVDL